MKQGSSSRRTVAIEEVLAPLDNGKVIQQGWSPQCETWSANFEEWGVLKTTAIQPGFFLEHENKKLPEGLEPRPGIEVKTGDILMTCAGPRNRCGIVCFVRNTRSKLLLSGKIYRFRANPAVINPRYLEYFLLSKEATDEIDRMKTGISDSGLNLTHSRFLKLPVPLQDLATQKEIVAKIDTLFAEIDAGTEELLRTKQKLEHYKQSVLNAAIQGKLVPQDPNDEPASKLLERIRAEKEKLIKEGKIKKEKPLPPIDPSEVPFELPKGWEWVRLKDLANLKGGLAKDSGKTHVSSKRLPYLRVANVQRGFLDLAEIKEIDVPSEKLPELLLQHGDVLFNEGGDRDKLGRGWVWESQIDPCIHQNHVFRARLYSPDCNPFLLSHYGNTFGQKYFLDQGKQTTNLASVSLSVLGNLPVPVPPSNYQDLVISALNEILGTVNNEDHELTTMLNHSSALKQSVLKAAFEGALI